MTRNEVLGFILAAAEDVGCVFDYADIQQWVDGLLEAVCHMGLLRRSATGLYAPCPNCDEGHIEPVMMRVGPDGAKRFYIWCPEAMRVKVAPEMCNGWEVDLEGLAQAVGAAMDLKSKPKAIVPGRLWRLGRTPWKDVTREVLLAVRIRDTDAVSIAAHVGPGGRAIVFVPQFTPDDRIWPNHIPAVIPLSRVATLAPQGIELDMGSIIQIVADADALAEARSAVPVDPEVKKQVIRQQIKAEVKTHLEDDVLIGATMTHGSVRAAAKALTEQLGRKVSKDKVHRAVKRAGGADALKENSDSASVARTVASQPRDRAKKIAQRR